MVMVLIMVMPAMVADLPIDTEFPFCSHRIMERDGDLAYKIVKLEPEGQEVLARVNNFAMCKAAFEKALFVYPTDTIEMRQGARVILRSRE
jgi:hypothetical protein